MGLIEIVLLGANIDRVWDVRGALSTCGLERHGQEAKIEWGVGTAKRQRNQHDCSGYVAIMRRNNIDIALVILRSLLCTPL